MLFTCLAAVLLALIFGAVLYQEDVQPAATPINVPNTTETLVVVSANVTTPNPNGKAVVRGWLELTVGPSTTAVTVAIYAGAAIGGRVVGTRNAEAGDFTPGNTAHFEVEFVDIFSNTGGVQYTLSVLQTGATGPGTVQAALIDTKVLSG